jgi:hypothetical protein
MKRRRIPDPECEEYIQILANDTLQIVREKQGKRWASSRVILNSKIWKIRQENKEVKMNECCNASQRYK